MRRSSLFALLGALASSEAFVAPSLTSASVAGTISASVLHMSSPRDLGPVKYIGYGEESRKFRRTVYTHDDWVKHRSPNRFVRNLKAIFVSGVYKSVVNEILITSAIALNICLYNCLVGGFEDFEGVKHAAIISMLPVVGLPLAPFTLASSSLGLLLGM
jgi:putative membrane protein